MSTSILEELLGNAYSEIAYAPHMFHKMRQKFQIGYSNPDEPRLVHMNSFNRKHKYREHYLHKPGNQNAGMLGAN